MYYRGRNKEGDHHISTSLKYPMMKLLNTTTSEYYNKVHVSVKVTNNKVTIIFR